MRRMWILLSHGRAEREVVCSIDNHDREDRNKSTPSTLKRKRAEHGTVTSKKMV